MSEKELKKELWFITTLKQKLNFDYKKHRRTESLNFGGLIILFVSFVVLVSLFKQGRVQNLFIQFIAVFGIFVAVLAMVMLYVNNEKKISVPDTEFDMYTRRKYLSQPARDLIKKSIYKNAKGVKSIAYYHLLEALDYERAYIEGLLDYLTKSEQVLSSSSQQEGQEI